MVIINNLINYYKLDDISGAIVDSHGSDNGTNNGTTYGAGGIINTCLDFERDDPDYVALLYDSKYDLQDFSVSLWFNNETSSATRQHIYHFDHNTLTYGSKLVRLNNNDIEVYCGGAAVAKFDYIGTTGAWVHVVMTRNATTCTLYVNGISRDTTGVGALGTLSAKHRLGRDALDANTNYFDGLIDEVGIWGRELLSTEVTALYNSGNGLAYPFTVGPFPTHFRV